MNILYTLSTMIPGEGATERMFAFSSETARDEFSEAVRVREGWARKSLGSVPVVTPAEAMATLTAIDEERSNARARAEMAALDEEIAAQRQREFGESSRDAS